LLDFRPTEADNTLVSTTTREVLFTVGYVVAGLVAVVCVGYVTYQKGFFHFPEPMMSFLFLGLVGALVYASVQLRGAGYAVLAIAFLFLTEVDVDSVPDSLVGTAIYALPVGFALMAAAYVQKLLARLRFGRFISMGLIFGAGFALRALLSLLMSGAGFSPGAVWEQALLGAKLGAAMGLGFELIDLIGPRPEREPRPGPGAW